jgi:hypothetical protein
LPLDNQIFIYNYKIQIINISVRMKEAHEMKKRLGLNGKIGVVLLLLSFACIPIFPSMSWGAEAAAGAGAAGAGAAGAGAAAGLSGLAIAGIVAGVVAAIALAAAAIGDDGGDGGGAHHGGGGSAAHHSGAAY